MTENRLANVCKERVTDDIRGCVITAAFKATWMQPLLFTIKKPDIQRHRRHVVYSSSLKFRAEVCFVFVLPIANTWPCVHVTRLRRPRLRHRAAAEPHLWLFVCVPSLCLILSSCLRSVFVQFFRWDAAGCVALHAFYISTRTTEENRAVVPFIATL